MVIRHICLYAHTMANRVVAGDYMGADVTLSRSGLTLYSLVARAGTALNRDTVESYELVDTSRKKSATSAVGRAFVGSALLGPAGLLAGMTGKTREAHTVAVEFVDGKRSLMTLSDAYYRALMRAVF